MISHNVHTTKIFTLHFIDSVLKKKKKTFKSAFNDWHIITMVVFFGWVWWSKLDQYRKEQSKTQDSENTGFPKSWETYTQRKTESSFIVEYLISLHFKFLFYHLLTNNSNIKTTQWNSIFCILQVIFKGNFSIYCTKYFCCNWTDLRRTKKKYSVGTFSYKL